MQWWSLLNILACHLDTLPYSEKAIMIKTLWLEHYFSVHTVVFCMNINIHVSSLHRISCSFIFAMLASYYHYKWIVYFLSSVENWEQDQMGKIILICHYQPISSQISLLHTVPSASSVCTTVTASLNTNFFMAFFGLAVCL